ncbi:phage integrase Arm DNA-binding domain-containing protein [Pseudomonas syringae]|nr:phage integrase Arm DNA-binding domain-containing protein [Pseudomonas syringae]MBI6748557.1 phage integrase Arm DNA-binding domain-containing protein [Pseudomonas syringae]MBI6762635.1 phage integrase Arm DNA-binding domain-containing protein [Pseudomonas syringae]MBI6807140.1 phage integrase Arm DNA-binding domain-containing protein [Pseudomonas syringae]MBI6829668.1 phage integrase Arm DNA-binding domain-containing protein [Pseudomonas syringae]
MRPRNTENRDLPPGMVRRKRPRKNGTLWVGYYYRDANGKELPLGGDLDKARLKWAELEAKTRANREIALLSHVYNMAREWGLTDRENPCAGVRKNKEKVRDYYANDMVWAAVYGQAPQELKDAMDLAYLTGQRPADVIAMNRGYMEGDSLNVQQGKTGKRLRIQMQTAAPQTAWAC